MDDVTRQAPVNRRILVNNFCATASPTERWFPLVLLRGYCSNLRPDPPASLAGASP